MMLFARLADQVLPILLLLGLGRALGHFGVLKDSAVEELKKLVVYTALPAVLFLSFLKIDLEPSYLTLFFILLGVCIGLQLLGRVFGRLMPTMPRHLPFMTTGFEYGMLALSLFGGAFGLEAVGYIAVVDLGHEFFIWFVYVAMLLAGTGNARPADLLRMFLTSPVIIAIVLGLAFNGAGWAGGLETLPVFSSLMRVLELLGALTIPLILIIVGHSVRIERVVLVPALRVVALRLALVIPLALLLNRFVLRGLLGLAHPFETALMVLFIMPPPFILPLFMQDDDPREKQVITGVLAVHTVVSVVLFVGYLVLVPEL